MTACAQPTTVRARRLARGLPVAVATGCGLTIAAGLGIEAAGGNLGVPLPPFFADWDPVFDVYALLAAGALAAGVGVAPRLLGLSPAAFAAAVALLALALRLALASAGGGPEQWWSVFGSDPEAQNEYLPALAALDPGVGAFLDRFAEVAPSLPIHPSAHPPGILLLLHWLGIDAAKSMAALVIGVGVLSVPLVYVLGRQLLDEAAARWATIAFCFAPSALLYGATSTDALFVTLGLATAVALLARRSAVRLLGGPLLFLASFFSYSLLAVGAWAAAVVWLREGTRPALRLAAVCGASVVAGYGLLWALVGFDLPGTLAAADEAYRRGIASARPYEFWVFGSPTAFLVAAGIPLSWLAVRGVAERRPTALALALVVVTAAVLGFTKAENERIWLFLVPLLCLAASEAGRRFGLKPLLGALAAQALAAELLLETIW